MTHCIWANSHLPVALSSPERLETRYLFAQTPEILIELELDRSYSLREHTLSQFYQLGDEFVAVVNNSDLGFAVNVARQSTWHATPELPGIPDDIVQFGEKLYMFLDADQARFQPLGPGQQLWTYASDEGLQLVRKISPYGSHEGTLTGQQDPFVFTFGEHLYFLADEEVTLNEQFEVVSGAFGLWRTNGTEAGTVPVLHLFPGLESLDWATNINDHLLLSANTSEGNGLWSFDGTVEGTIRLSGETATTPIVLGDNAYFVMNSDVGRELHVWNSATNEVSVLFDLNPGVADSDPNELIHFNEGLVFTANDAEGTKLWFTDGTESGTRSMFDGVVSEITVADQVYFVSEMNGEFKLFRTDTTTVSLVFSSPFEIDVLGATEDMVLFASSGETYSAGAKLASSEPIVFEIPGTLRHTTNKHFVFTTETVEYIEIPYDEFAGAVETYIESVYSVQPWISDGTNDGTKRLGEPAEDRRAPAWPSSSSNNHHRVLSVQSLDERILVRTFSDRGDPTDLLSIMVFAYDESPAPISGDADGNGEVDFADFLILSANFGKTDAVFADGDFNANGEVDFEDFLILAESFGECI